MHILFTRFPLESTLGGAEIQTLTLMEGLIDRGHSVEFAGSCPTLLAECRKRKISVTELDIGKPPVTAWAALSFVWRKRSMRKKLYSLINQLTNKPDVVCMLSLSEKLLLTDVAASKGITPIWIEHDRIGRWLTKNPWLSLLLRQSKKATTVTVSELSKRLYVGVGWNADDVVAIPNGIDQSRLGASKKQDARNKMQMIGCISRLSPEKGVDVLIKAFNGVSDNLHLEIVGEGPEQHSLESLAQVLHVEKRVTFRKKSPDLSAIFDRFDVLVLPSSDHDPFGLVAAEAMMYGVPVIVTDACGIADQLTHNNDALIVPAGDSNALKEAITSLVDSTTREKLAKEAKKTAEKKFSTKHMVDQYVSLFTRGSTS